MRVANEHRDTEFILLKRALEREIEAVQARGEELETWSCEQWALHLLWKMNLDKCEVSEDGENGAIVERD